MTTRLIKRSLLFFTLLALVAPLFVGGTRVQAVGGETDGEASADPQYLMDWHVTGPTGGDVRALVIDPNDAQRFYFGTLDGQIYTSTDGGEQWRLLSNFNRPKLTHSPAIGRRRTRLLGDKPLHSRPAILADK